MPQTAPTKSNLMAMKKSLALARLGYDLLDRKRNLMMREMMRLIDDVKSIQGDISSAFATAYASLRNANMTLGQNEVFRIALSRATDDDITRRRRPLRHPPLPRLPPQRRKPRRHIRTLQHQLLHRSLRTGPGHPLLHRSPLLHQHRRPPDEPRNRGQAPVLRPSAL